MATAASDQFFQAGFRAHWKSLRLHTYTTEQKICLGSACRKRIFLA
jgi:hypothetical protein